MSEPTGVETVAGPTTKKTLWQRIKRQFTFTKEGGKTILWIFRVMFAIWLVGTIAAYIWRGFYEPTYWLVASWVFIAGLYWLLWQWDSGMLHKVIKSVFGLLDDFSKLQEHTIRAWDLATKEVHRLDKENKELQQSNKDLRARAHALDAALQAERAKAPAKRAGGASKSPKPRQRSQTKGRTKAAQ